MENDLWMMKIKVKERVAFQNERNYCYIHKEMKLVETTATKLNI